MSERDVEIIVPAAPHAPETAKVERSMRREIFFFAAAIVLLGGFAAAFFLLPFAAHKRMAMNNGAELSNVAQLEEKVRTIEGRVTELEAGMQKIASAPQPAASAAAEPITPLAASDLARMQSDLVAVSAAVGGLQAEVKRVGATAAETTAQDKSALSEALELMQLRVTAGSGHSFTQELTDLQGAAKGDAEFQEILARLAPYADKGAPSMAVLREDLAAHIAVVEQAIAKANAHGFWDRVIAELKGLISVRRVHGETASDTTLEDMQAALEKDDIAGALGAMKNLQPEAQDSLKDWRSLAEARLAVDETLRMLAARLIAGANAPLAAPATP